MKIYDSKTGSALVMLLITMPFLLFIASVYMQLSVNNYKVARKDHLRTHAQLATDAGADYAIQQINQNGAWTGTGGEVELQNNSTSRSTYQSTVTDVDARHKTITTIGKAYRPGSATPGWSTTIKVGLRAVTTGEYSVVSGVGGMIMQNSAKILGGDVFINGGLNMINSSQVGLVGNPVNLKIAHQNCPVPADATYPRICNPGENGEPITIANPAQIYGEVKANNQISGARMSLPGLVASSGVTTQPLPPHDRAAQKAAVVSSQTGIAASCDSIGDTRTWPANSKIIGDVRISKNCKVTLEGNVWITGKFDMENSGQLIVSNAVGATRPSVMVDGQKTFFKNSAAIVSNASNTGAQIISYWSQASCSPDCADVTGVDLYNSRNEPTIELDNTASGVNTIFYSRWTKVMISNSGQIGALVGQTVELKNSGTITFGSSLGTGTTYWVIEDYRRVFN